MLHLILKHKQLKERLIFMNISVIAGAFYFSHPADFTPVCTTELGRTALLQDEFAKRNVKVLAVSVDPLDKHFEWRKDINDTQNCNVGFPLIADEDRKVASLYDMIHPNASATAT